MGCRVAQKRAERDGELALRAHVVRAGDPNDVVRPPIEADRASARVEVRMGMQHADYRERVLVDVGLTAESELDGSSSSHLA